MFRKTFAAVCLLPCLCAAQSFAPTPTATAKLQPKIVFVRADAAQGVDATESTAVVSAVTGDTTGFVDGGPLMASTAKNARRSEIAIMNPDGSGVTNLKAFGTDPAVSPDGTRIAFCSIRKTLYFQIYVMNSDGTDQRRITDIKTGDACGPVWSPDGKKIAFYAYQKPSPMREGVIYTMSPDGSEMKEIVKDAITPVWSPDGKKIAFVSYRDKHAQIYRIDVNGSNLKRLTDHAGEDSAPAWAPDGQSIAFVSDRDGMHAIYLMDPDGGHLQRLLYSKKQDFCFPSWSPDGNTLGFTTMLALGKAMIVGEERPRCEAWSGEYQIFAFTADGKTKMLTDTKIQGYHQQFGMVASR